MIEEYYDWYKVIHILAVISWMAAMLYLPRLFVYHTRAKGNRQMEETFQLMEKRLLRFIMTPAMLITYIFGL